jgi:hypothetical protein
MVFHYEKFGIAATRIGRRAPHMVRTLTETTANRLLMI